MSCFCRRPNSLSPHIFRKIETLEKQISAIFSNGVIDLFVVKVMRPSTQSNQTEVQLIYRTNMDSLPTKSEGSNTEEARLINQIMSAAQSFASDFKSGFKYDKLHIKGNKCMFSLYSLSSPSSIPLDGSYSPVTSNTISDTSDSCSNDALTSPQSDHSKDVRPEPLLKESSKPNLTISIIDILDETSDLRQHKNKDYHTNVATPLTKHNENTNQNNDVHNPGSNHNSSNSQLLIQRKDYIIAFYLHGNVIQIDCNACDKQMHGIILDFAHLLQNVK